MSSSDTRSRRSPGGPLAPLVNLFSSVWFGIALLALLFLYCTIGSAGLMYPVSFNMFTWDNWDTLELRTMRGIELTEYEWFEWWPFNLLMALTALNIAVVTIRRIRFNAINLGVWMIHSGILILIIGSVMYFSANCW